MDGDVIRWKIRAKTAEHKRKIERSISIIQKSNSAEKMVISWSAGKDSTAMAHLIISIFPETPIMIQFDDCDWPSKRGYVDRIIESQKWKVNFVEPDFSVWDKMKDGDIQNEHFCAQSHSLTKESFLKPLKAMQEKLCCDGVYIGLRSDESKNRKIHLKTRGEFYRLKSGEWRCCPIASWTAEDVFAYLIKNSIEINPCYLNNKFLPPEKIRISWAIPTPESFSRGDMEHIRFYYQKQYQRLKDLGVA